jgi:protein-S-isoprenylcysteine O-methyltransferase Ste14
LNSSGELFTRWRVRLGYPVALTAFFLARPTPRSIALGAAIAMAGLLLRAAAAGYLHKHEWLATSGPYAYTRNPLYFGSALLTAGFLISVNSWWAAIIVGVYFALFYPAVMHREERELRARYADAFDEYQRRVPLFFPRPTPARMPGASSGQFSWEQYRRNREHQAAIGLFVAVILLIVLMRWRS